MLESISPRAHISDDWQVEVETRQESKMVIVNLVNTKTGEIRQKRVSFDSVARRVFRNEIQTWRKRHDDIDVIKERRI